MFVENLEYIHFEKQTTDFPKHFHETFCISLIYNGIEQIEFDSKVLFSEEGSITITNPYDIHSNPILDSSAQLTFDTLYLSSDLMRYLNNGKSLTFSTKKINCPKANYLFVAITEAIDANNPKNVELLLRQFIQRLKRYSTEKDQEYSELNLSCFSQVNDHIESHIQDRFCLDELARMVNINKFGFSKKFKASTGMSPMNYVLMKKIFSSKKLISSDSELTEIAYQFNFSDLPHFSKTFKRYIGISPQKYKESIIGKH